MTLHARLLAIFSSGLLLLSPGVSADWQADVHVKGPLEPREIEGKAFGTATGLRLDYESAHGPMSTIVDLKLKRVWTLMHSQKTVAQSGMERSPLDVPNCEGIGIEACLVRYGFTKANAESVNGHLCSVFTKGPMTLWHPTDLKNVMAVRAISSQTSSATTVDFTNVKEGESLDSALFTPPTGYRAAGKPAGINATVRVRPSPDDAAKTRDELLSLPRDPNE